MYIFLYTSLYLQPTHYLKLGLFTPTVAVIYPSHGKS